MSDPDVMSALDQRLSEHNLRGQWKSEGFLSAAVGGPRPAGEPARWHWGDVTKLLDEAGAAMPESLQARRSLIFQNPGLPKGTSHTLNMGVQMILPGEVAWSHRHSISALRFIIEGDEKLTTVVDGQHCVMQTGDLVLTPNWAWHDHHNASTHRAFWLDVLDVPLVLGLNQVFYQPGEIDEQPRVDHEIPRGIMRFPWSKAIADTMALPVDPLRGQSFEYRDPTTGGPCLPTLSCRLLRLPPGFQSAKLRSTASFVGFVVRGQGHLKVATGPISLQPRDAFVVPNWSWQQIVNDSPHDDLVIFVVSDEPVIRALGFFREQTQAKAVEGGD
jgi:1-hydroxy-2-naphthoate dioxygenase